MIGEEARWTPTKYRQPRFTSETWSDAALLREYMAYEYMHLQAYGMGLARYERYCRYLKRLARLAGKTLAESEKDLAEDYEGM